MDKSKMYRIKFVESPRSWDETIMVMIVNLYNALVFEGTISEANLWLKKNGMVYIKGTNGLWCEPKENWFSKLFKGLDFNTWKIQ